MNLRQGTLLKHGEYRIERELGHGGFGVTYSAVQVGLNRRVAIKEFFMSEYCNRDAETSHVTVPSEGSKELVAKFRNKFIKEAQNIASLKHPHIISIHDVFEENGTAYYVMEYLDHGSLADLVKRQGRLPEADALCYTRQIADALRYIHARKMSHLDVKPGNILIDEEDHAVLIDFGLSKRYDDEGNQTSTTPVGISHGYAPLEQYKKGGVGTFSPSTDIYSLGATLYKLITGATPPDANDILIDGLPAHPGIMSLPVYEAIEQAMQPNKNHRPQSIEAFLTRLDAPAAPAPETAKVEDVPTEVIAEEPASVDNDNTSYPLRLEEESPMERDSADITVPSPRAKSSFSPKKLLWPLLACLVAVAIFFGVRACNDYRAEAAHLAEIEQHRLDSIAQIEEASRLAQLEQQRKDSIAKAEAARRITYTVKGVDFTMIKVDGGTYTMGADETAHQVTLSDFCMGETEVTQALWQAVMGNNPSGHTGNGQYPVEDVSWPDCQNFARKLYNLTGVVFRLPTEAEWEYAARGGNKSRGYKYSGSDDADEVAWYRSNSPEKTQPVKGKQPNELGLYDMSGNVDEWCNDIYAASLPTTPQMNPRGPSKGANHVIRGGSVWNTTEFLGLDYRNFIFGSTSIDTGLRLVAVLDSAEIAETTARWENEKNQALAEQRKNEQLLSSYTGVVNGHKYVDLGLSVKWATCNVGASSPSGCGNYYAWAETEPKTCYNEGTYKFCDVRTDENGRNANYYHYVSTKYTDISGTEYDVAHVKWGATWRMPMEKDWKELEEKCQWVWITYNGMNGYRVTGPNGNNIFLPAAGTMISERLSRLGEQGEYYEGNGVKPWKTISRNYIKKTTYSAGANCSHGCPVRPVTE